MTSKVRLCQVRSDCHVRTGYNMLGQVISGYVRLRQVLIWLGNVRTGYIR
jgi:hypothetical protein